jgi:hypothetical protein
MNKVTVTANAEGKVVSISKSNPKYGYVRVEQTRAMVDERGWVSKKSLSSLIHGEIDILNSLGYFNGQELPGNIIIKESLDAFNTDAPERDYKIAGKSGIVCCLDGQPIYRKCFYDATGSKSDELIAHNNTSAIRTAMLEAEETVEGFNI